MKKPPLAILITSILLSQVAIAEEKNNSFERFSILGNKQELSKSAGSVTFISETELEKFEYDDIARILATIPGVNVRQEDGYGLRPNIGFRGVTPERSKKINIMEDGVLISPAPYSAPAAYYFPMTSRMTAVEVTKGPSTIKYGPNTVAGAINLVTRQVPVGREAGLDVSLGSDGYGKAHGYFGDNIDDFGYLVEGIHLRADGFKELDGGGNTGFDKSDVMAKFNYQLDGDDYQQVLELKLSHASETSDETYLGLTDDDFDKNPYRRYAASQLDVMEWEHQQVQFSHHIEFENFNATTKVYRNDFERAWFKLNGFGSSQGGSIPTLQQILTNPTDEQNQVYYQVLTGQADSTLREIIVLGTNDREYYSQGLQIDMTWDMSLFGFSHQLASGIRYHEDEIERNHIEDNFLMRSGLLQSTGEATVATATNTEQTEAISVYLQDTLTLDDLTVTAGLRGELIDSYFKNRSPQREQDFQYKTTRLWLPSISAYYGINDNSGVFGGVHQGFVPTSPIQSVDIKIEKSINYELGWRYEANGNKAEVVGFFSDYSNLKESCSISAGCDTDVEFNAGAVDIYGIEASFSDNFEINKQYSVPLAIVYTHTQSSFKETFYSDFEQWGFVTAGDSLPYLAKNMLSISLGLTAENWQVAMLVNYTDEMPEVAQTALTGDIRDSTLAGLHTESTLVVDMSASYELNHNSQFYMKLDNLLDSTDIVSRRPFGARPSKPRQVSIGYKYRF
ncbi:MAG: TonB-dependent receptor [Paraglaciecola sp.]|uniref:TonB-dependent receptor family protein n=1 Tax=Paraglaciecola sp. TaxID=1920173 RepID=UPI003296CB0E